MGFEVINLLKREKGLTNAQLAEQAGVTLSTVDKITAGVNTNPKLDTLIAICNVLGCSLNDFVDSPNKKEKSSEFNDLNPEDENDVVSLLTKMLVHFGYIEAGSDLSDSDFNYLSHIVGLLDAYFEQKRKR